MALELSIIVPTYNETQNLEPLIDAVSLALKNINWEIIFVDDDSPDCTAEHAHEIARNNNRVRCIHRISRRGLSSACIEGMLSSSAPYIAVMDADLQHDETILIDMLNRLKNEDLDLVVGSRYMSGGSTGELASNRVFLSKFASSASKLLLKTPLNDPMSGFFMLTRKHVNKTAHNLSGKGFKILLDMFVSSDEKIKYAEIPYKMRSRKLGNSKLDAMVIWEYALLLIEKSVGKILPFRFIMFVAVGFTGLFLHLLILGFLHNYLEMSFLISQSAATIVAMTNNFIINNLFTYRDQRLHGLGFLYGLVSFYIACSIGAIINIVLAGFVFEHSVPWWLSGSIGALAGSVWNYAITSTFTWKKNKKYCHCADKT